MTARPDDENGRPTPRPIPESYWLVPGRLLVGEYPGTQSRAKSMDRLRRFLAAGVTCFVDLTEPWELRSYEAMLPDATRDGRPIEHVRESIPDHGIPAGAEVMQRVLDRIDDALDDGHVVYVHCRAGIGRSAMVAGCWLSRHGRSPAQALDELQRHWQQSAKSDRWPQVPETDEQTKFVLSWTSRMPGPSAMPQPRATFLQDRTRGAWLGLAAGDAAGAAAASGKGEHRYWTQHTALALCLAESLLEQGRLDARDQIERYLRWQREGHLSATAMPEPVTADIAKALAVYGWRRQPMAGSHDPRDRSTSALPRVVAAVTYSLEDVAAAVQLAGECARTTHQSPLVVDACRYFGAMLAGALRGDPPQAVLGGEYEPAPGLWAARPLKPAVRNMSRSSAESALAKRSQGPDALRAVAHARAAVAAAGGFEDCLLRTCRVAVEPALEAALAGALWGAFNGASAIPDGRAAALSRRELLESYVERLVERLPPLQEAGAGGRSA